MQKKQIHASSILFSFVFKILLKSPLQPRQESRSIPQSYYHNNGKTLQDSLHYTLKADKVGVLHTNKQNKKYRRLKWPFAITTLPAY